MSGWDTAAPADDAAIATESNDNDPMDTGGHDANGADGGALNSGFDANGAGGGGDGCRRCGNPDHRVAECTEPDTRPCHNCGEVGHQKSECTAPRKPREGETCRRCESTEHVFRDCPLKDTPKEGQVCYDCGSNEHFPRDCPTRRHDERQKASAEELQTLWEKVVVADRSGDFDDVKQALLSYIKNDPDLTWPELEEKLRTENLKTHIIAEGPRVLPPSKELADNQRQGNKMYEAIFVRNARVLRQKLRAKNENEEEAINQNKEHLKDAGLIRERLREDGKYHVPEWAMSRLTTEQQYMAQNKCLRCGEDNHKTKDCKKEKEVDEKKQQKCFKCNQEGHNHRHCPNPDPENACKRCQGYGHNAKNCLLPDTRDFSCRRCGQEGHKASDCTEADTRPPMVCRRCQQEGHRASDCTEPDSRTCNNCGEPGHFSKECPQPRVRRCFTCQQTGHRSDACPNAPAGDDNETNAAVAMATDIPAEDLPSGASGSGW